MSFLLLNNTIVKLRPKQRLADLPTVHCSNMLSSLKHWICTQVNLNKEVLPKKKKKKNCMLLAQPQKEIKKNKLFSIPLNCDSCNQI